MKIRCLLRACVSLLLLFAIIAKSTAQDFKTDFEVVSRNYQNLEKFLGKIEINVYHGADSPEEVRTLIVEKEGNNYIHNSGEVLTLRNDRCLIMLRPEDKVIVYTEHPKNKDKKTSDTEMAGVDFSALEGNYDSVEFKGLEEGVKYYRMHLNSGPILTADIMIDDERKLFHKVTYTYRKQHEEDPGYRVVMNFKEQDTNPVYEQEKFSEKTFVSLENGVAKPADAYNTYEVIITE